MTSAETATTAAPDARVERRAKRIAKHLTSFAAQHGGSADGVVEYVGRTATRIVVVGADGTWGDQVAPTYAIGRRAAELAGLTLHDDFEGELGLKVKTGPYEWKRMAGIQI
ncbi:MULTISPECIES: hypothetical protein [Kitasatospora]|uniref:Uncharacterized protein n=1 Tax=Kitasatospora cheerisanensis KCTC 2395 TaxID=1348663 RepID=A0A066YX94_9ACTN|nr:hypothetical protein [Kitasatospora cheerisanensis]KDN82671.1 hypothetical protein KCH_55860 [Kitasatospora cheerisanensis KCTC 2395]